MNQFLHWKLKIIPSSLNFPDIVKVGMTSKIALNYLKEYRSDEP